MSYPCSFQMKITGKEQAVKELIAMLSREGEFLESGFVAISEFSAEGLQKTSVPGICMVEASGTCDWSVKSAMRDYGNRVPSLESEAERLSLVVEVYSSEANQNFQEHCFIVFGDVLIDDTLEYEEHWIPCFDNLETYNKVFDTDFTEDMVNDDGYVHIGGFGVSYGDFQDCAEFFKQEHNLESVKLDELEVCALFDNGDEFCSIVKAPNGKYFNYYSKDALIHRYGSAGPFETFQDAQATLYKHRPSIAPPCSDLASIISKADAEKQRQQGQGRIKNSER